MDLKRLFITNLRRFRAIRGISQMKLAELCDTAPNYIGQIEIGRRFPSIPLIEKIGCALGVAPYRFFIEETSKNNTELDDAINVLAKLPEQARLHAIHRISAALGECVKDTLAP